MGMWLPSLFFNVINFNEAYTRCGKYYYIIIITYVVWSVKSIELSTWQNVKNSVFKRLCMMYTERGKTMMKIKRK